MVFGTNADFISIIMQLSSIIQSLHWLGQPRRHLLTTGWSTFVTSKRLVAGDAFVFMRYYMFAGEIILYYFLSLSLFFNF